MTVRKRTWTTNGEKKTAYRVEYKDQSGKVCTRQFPRRKDADAFDVQVRHQVSQGLHTADSNSITVAQAGALWIERAEAEGLERTTRDGYEKRVEHINARIGSVKLSRLTAPMVETFRDTLLRDFSRSMAKMVLGALKMILTNAMRLGKVAQNVGLAVKIVTSSREKKKVSIPTIPEMRAILDTATGMAKPLLMTAAYTGFRGGELRGLKWSNVDFKRREITVTERADRYNEIGQPKSEASQRTCVMNDELFAVLTEWKKVCPEGELGLVFCNGQGKLESHSNLTQRLLYKTQIAAGVTRTTNKPATNSRGKTLLGEDGKPLPEIKGRFGFHAFRHFFASLMIKAGLPPKEIMELMGHSTIQLTMDTYGHLFPKSEGHAARINAAMNAAMSTGD